MRFGCLLVVLFSVASCEPGAPEPLSQDRRLAGGTFRQELVGFPFDSQLDPTSEYTSLGFALHSNLLLRPLMNYRHVAGARGNEVLPDLAAGMPEISEDQLTYTFEIDPSARFGPPVSRPITSEDVAYAFERMATPEVGAQYSFYFASAIEGFRELEQGEATSISGIETPDEKTVVFRLLRPTGDFLLRLGMPAAAPIPKELAGCLPEGSTYGRHLVASGPYMIEGSDAFDFETCDDLEPFSGFDPETGLTLVRNPDFDEAADDPRLRNSLPDRFEFVPGIDPDEILRHVESGTADLSSGSPSLDTLRRYASKARLRDNLHVQPGDRLWYMAMNLTVPPFDDVHVRRAVNFVMDRDSLVRAWGGPLQGDIATHVLPDNMLDGALEDYNPYPSRDFAGDVAKAHDEMRKSRYDGNGDGMCDVPACLGVTHVSQPGSPWETMSHAIEQSLHKIGIELDTDDRDAPYDVIASVPNEAAITSVPGWGKDYPDPFAFIGFLFDGRNIRAESNTNYSMVGLTRAQARALGVPYPSDGVPSIDADIDRCVATLDEAERKSCWSALDQQLTSDIAPWVPYLDANHLLITSDAVSPYEFDQFSGEISYARVGIDRSR